MPRNSQLKTVNENVLARVVIQNIRIAQRITLVNQDNLVKILKQFKKLAF